MKAISPVCGDCFTNAPRTYLVFESEREARAKWDEIAVRPCENWPVPFQALDGTWIVESEDTTGVEFQPAWTNKDFNDCLVFNNEEEARNTSEGIKGAGPPFQADGMWLVRLPATVK